MAAKLDQESQRRAKPALPSSHSMVARACFSCCGRWRTTAKRQREQRPFSNAQQDAQRHHQRVVVGETHDHHQGYHTTIISSQQTRRRNPGRQRPLNNTDEAVTQQKALIRMPNRVVSKSMPIACWK